MDISTDSSLLDLIEFEVFVPSIVLIRVGNRTFDKLRTNLKRGIEAGGWVEQYQIQTADKWGIKGKLPRWVVMEILALAKGELSEYYKLVRNQRNHPTNATNRRRPNN